jgi:hypothetical protein
VIHLGSGKALRIDAPQASQANKYIHGLTVRGKASTKPWIPASMVSTGGSLVFALGSAPDTAWGAGAGDVPPQATEPQAVRGTDFAAVAGKRFSGPVGVVTDSDTPAAALSATINWGDGTSSPGALTGTGGEYTVTGQHRYAQPGTYPATITVSDPGGLTVVTSTAKATVTAGT